jgi:hypothetical protein
MSPITRARLLVTLLVDGSFAFLNSERLRCRDGLSEAHVRELLQTYDNLLNPIPPGCSINQRKRIHALRDTFRDHARVAWGRSVIVGKHWRLGLTHQSVERGDLICAIDGSKVPLVLCPLGDSQFRLIGQCYFEGATRGEEAEEGDEYVEQFVLI